MDSEKRKLIFLKSSLRRYVSRIILLKDDYIYTEKYKKCLGGGFSYCAVLQLHMLRIPGSIPTILIIIRTGGTVLSCNPATGAQGYGMVRGK